MAKKKRIPEQQQQKKNYDGFVSPVLAVVGLLLLIAVFGLFDGTFLSFLKTFQAYLMGKLAFLLPVMLLLCAWKFYFDGRILSWNKNFFGYILVMLCLLGAAHHVFVPIKEELVPSAVTEGGGFVGGVIALILHRILGETGTGIFLAIATALSVALVIPWGRVYAYIKSLMANNDDYEEEEEPEVIPERTRANARTAKEFNREAAAKSKPVVFKPFQKPQKSAGLAAKDSKRNNPYESSDFDSFHDGLKKESGFKRILNFGSSKNVYTEDPIRQDIERDPVQVPDWEETPRREPVMVPIINYGGDKPAAMPGRSFLDPSSAAQPEPERVQHNDGRGLIVNNYRHEEPAEAAHAAQTATGSVTSSVGHFDFEMEEEPYAQEPAQNGNNGFDNNAANASDEADTDYVDSVDEGEVDLPPSERNITIVDSADKVKNATYTEGEGGEAEPQGEEAETVEPEAPKYILPPVEILNTPKLVDPSTYHGDIMEQCATLEKTLADFRVRAKVINVTRGPSVTRFELEPAPGVKVSSVVNLSDDIALRLAAPGVRIEAPIPGKSAIGIEAPNTKNDTVCFREVVDTDVVRSQPSKLCIGLGKDISGNIITADLAKMPHLLVAGSTGSGKSVCINTIIAGILYKARPDEVKLILVDPKVVELTNYNGIPHLLTPVVTEPKKAASALHWAVVEMERRYQIFADSHVREINSYNAQAKEKLPFIVIIIDELSDLMMVAKVDVEEAILRLAQKARAAGIHLILATQRPSVDVITGIVKANIPSRIAFAVSSQTDSRTILDTGGAEKLLGKGDMLFFPIGVSKPVRVQGAFVSDAELNKVVDFIVKQSIPVDYKEEVTAQELSSDAKNSEPANGNANDGAPQEDELFADAVRLVMDMGQASSSMLQRRFRIGYTRAARLVDTMEELGIVSQSVGSKPREVVMTRQEVEERFLQ